MLKNHSLSIWLLLASLLVVVALIAVPAIYATSKGDSNWHATYPNSNSGGAGCQLCHGSSTGQLNAYGRDMCLEFVDIGFIPSDWGATFLTIEDVDSDLDPNASSNGLEIANDAQPGWTTAANPLYVADFTKGCTQVAADSTVPNTVPLPYDIIFTGDPIANPGGPYEALVGETITFDGSGSTDDGEIVSYDWLFGDGTTGTGMTAQHTYTMDGIYTVTLTVIDNDGRSNSSSTTATISAVSVLDLDIASLKVTKSTKVGKPISIKLTVENQGTVLGQAIATVVGMQDGVEVYNWRLNVYDYNGKGTTSFSFQTYTPAAKGTINWTATIADDDPDVDEATATTVVK